MCAYPIVAAIARWDRRFEFDKRSQLFIRTHNVQRFAPPAMRVSNEGCRSS
jgi:hypothetical protein